MSEQQKNLFEGLKELEDPIWNGETPETAKPRSGNALENPSSPPLHTGEIDEGTFPCEKCNGTGTITVYRSGGGWGQRGKSIRCPVCHGKKVFHTSPATRRKNRERARRKVEEQARLNREEATQFLKDEPAIAGWFEANKGWMQFAADLHHKLFKYGALTENQIAAIERAIVKAKERDANREQVDVSGAGFAKLLEGFASAVASGLKRPRLTIAGIVFSRAKDNSKNPGCLYVKFDSQYQGKITKEGAFYPVRACVQEVKDAVQRIGNDPYAEAIAHGIKTGRCSCCGRELTRADSIERGMGAICAGKWGW